MFDYLELDSFASKITQFACIFFTFKVLKAKKGFWFGKGSFEFALRPLEQPLLSKHELVASEEFHGQDEETWLFHVHLQMTSIINVRTKKMSQFPQGIWEEKTDILRTHFWRGYGSQRHGLPKALNAVLILTLPCSRTEPSILGIRSMHWMMKIACFEAGVAEWALWRWSHVTYIDSRVDPSVMRSELSKCEGFNTKL